MMKRIIPFTSVFSTKRPHPVLLAAAVILLWATVAGCSPAGSGQTDIFQYKDSYVGDNGAVGNIVDRLPGSADFQGMELKTAEEPYGIILRYAPDEELSEAEVKERVLYNASFLFALVKNADWVEVVYGEQPFEVTRESLQSWYGTDLRSFSAEEELAAYVRQRLSDPVRVEQFFSLGGQ